VNEITKGNSISGYPELVYTACGLSISTIQFAQKRFGNLPPALRPVMITTLTGLSSLHIAALRNTVLLPPTGCL